MSSGDRSFEKNLPPQDPLSFKTYGAYQEYQLEKQRSGRPISPLSQNEWEELKARDQEQEQLKIGREEVRRSFERDLSNRGHDHEYHAFLSDVVVQRLGDVTYGMSVEDAAEYFDMLKMTGLDFRTQEEGAHSSRASRTNSTKIFGRVFFDIRARFGAEVAHKTIIEFVRAKCLQSLTFEARAGEPGRFSWLNMYSSVLEGDPAHVDDEMDGAMNFDVNFPADSIVARSAEERFEILYQLDPDLFADIMFTGYRSGGARPRAVNGNFSSLKHSGFDVGYGRVLFTSDGLPYRPGHKDVDIDAMQRRMQMWEAQTGERPQTREDLEQKIKSVEYATVKEQERAAGAEKQRDVAVAEVDRLKLTLAELRRSAIENIARAEEGKVEAEREVKEMKDFLREIMTEVTNFDTFGKRGTGLEKIKKMLEDKNIRPNG